MSDVETLEQHRKVCAGGVLPVPVYRDAYERECSCGALFEVTAKAALVALPFLRSGVLLESIAVRREVVR